MRIVVVRVGFDGLRGRAVAVYDGANPAKMNDRRLQMAEAYDIDVLIRAESSTSCPISCSSRLIAAVIAALDTRD
jgi:hypothetical protein